MYPWSHIAVAMTAWVLHDPGMALFEDLGLSFTASYAPQEIVQKLRQKVQCTEPQPGATSCKATERLGPMESSVVINVAQGLSESFVESLSVLFTDPPEGLHDALRQYLDRRYKWITGADDEWCGGEYTVTLSGGEFVTLMYWNIFKRDTSMCRDGRIIKMVPFVVPGGFSKPPVFLGLGTIDWGVFPGDFHERNPEFDRWTFESGSGKGLTARMDMMLRDAEVTYFFNTIAGSLSEVRIRFTGLSRVFRERLLDQFKDVFRYHSNYEFDEGVFVKGRLCKEDLHVMLEDGPKGFVVRMFHNSDGFCVD